MHVDLVAAVLDSGAPVSRALTLVAGVSAESVDLSSGPHPSGGSDEQRLVAVLRHTARLLELGADPAAAWAPCAAVEGMRPVAAAAIRTSASGALLARSLRTSAATLRRDQQAAALVRAQRVGVLAMLPLGLCFLPAFLCIGVVPTVVAVMGRALSGTGISP